MVLAGDRDGPRSEDAASRCGVSPAVASGGSGRVAGCAIILRDPARAATCRSPSARRSPSCGPRAGGAEIAREIGRSPSTISRELRRNAATRGGSWSTGPRWRSGRPSGVRAAQDGQARREPRAARVRPGPARRRGHRRRTGPAGAGSGGAVDGRRHGPRARTGAGRAAWSPEQIANRLQIDFPDDESMRISPRGDLPGAVRPGPRRAAPRADRVPAHRTGAARAPGPDPRARQGVRHRRGADQPAARRGRRPGRSRALGGRPDPRRRTGPRSAPWSSAPPGSRCCCTCPAWPATTARVKNGPPSAGHGAEAVRDAIAATITTLPEQLRRSLTWDQGAETGPARPAADRHRPAGVLLRPAQPLAARHQREHQRAAAPVLPQGHRPRRHRPDDLDAVAAALNSRPRKTLGWNTPAEALDESLAAAA